MTHWNFSRDLGACKELLKIVSEKKLFYRFGQSLGSANISEVLNLQCSQIKLY